jgi:cytochrome b6-f complex iron-sulfur subunit
MVDTKNKKEHSEHKQGMTRRGFLRYLWLGLGGLILMEYVWLVIAFLRPRKRPDSGDGAVPVVAGPVDRFEEGTVTAVPAGKFYLARQTGGGFLAISRECTHLGCTVPWIAEKESFVCPCHASSFDINGDVLGGPAPRALDVFAVRIENNIVKVDVSRPIRRQSFAVSQLTQP